MNNKLYYWAENLENYIADNEESDDQVIEIKRLNFFIGKNNAGKSRFLRSLYTSPKKIKDHTYFDATSHINQLKDLLENSNEQVSYKNAYNPQYKHNLVLLINSFLEVPKFPIKIYKEKFIIFLKN